jgi:arylsulfatase A-like enzyme
LPHAPIDYNREYEGSHFIDDVWGDWPEGTPQIHVTEANGKQALDFLKNRPKEEDRPFYLSVHFFATHAEDDHKDQYLPQKRSKSLYKDVTIPVTETSDVGDTDKFYKKMPYFFEDNNEARTRWRWRFDTPKKHQRMMKNYYRMATEVDTASGQIIEELQKQGVLDNTVIIFTTDNGNFHAEHGLADKWYPHQGEKSLVDLLPSSVLYHEILY